MNKSVKILAINSSPQEFGKVSTFLEQFISSIRKLEVEIKRIDLYKEPVEPITGKVEKTITRLSSLQKDLIECDGFIIATPTYWFNVPGVLKFFIDNLTTLEENELLEGKVAGIMVYSPEGGEFGVISTLALALNHMGVLFPPYAFLFYRGEQDTWFEKDIPLLAKNMIQLIKVQKKSKINWDY